MTMPKVSIVIPVYNGSNYLSQAIESALSQTYANTEILVVNDGSDDNERTEAIAGSFGDKIRYFKKPNGGVSSALNLGIVNMTGDLFTWLSHDDLISPNRIETDVNLFRSDKNIRVTFCRLVIINENGNKIKEIETPYTVVSTPKEALLLGGVDMGTMTIHRSCFKRAGLFDENNLTTQDVVMSLSLIKHYPFVFNDQAVKYSREHAQRGTYTMKDQVKKDSLLLCDFLHREFCFEDFFPGMKAMDRSDIKKGWEWLGKLYRYFGAEEYAKACFQNAEIAVRDLQR